MELFSPLPVTNSRLFISIRRTLEIPCTVMRTLSFPGIFNNSFDFSEKVLSESGGKKKNQK